MDLIIMVMCWQSETPFFYISNGRKICIKNNEKYGEKFLCKKYCKLKKMYVKGIMEFCLLE